MAAIDIMLIVLNVLNLLCHSTGTYLLISVYKKGKKTVQQMLLINLSITELVISLPILAEEALDYVSSSHTAPAQTAKHIIYVAINVLFCSYYTSMFYITADRFFGVMLNIKYPLYWSVKKTKVLLLSTALLISIGIVALTVTYKYRPFHYTRIFTLYVHSVLNVAFLLLSISTYAYIFYKYTTRHVASSDQSNDDMRSRGVCAKLCKSKFYITFLLLISFLLFMVIPNIYFLFKERRGHGHFENDSLKDAVNVFYEVSFLSDAVIYIFLNPLVRAELRNVLASACRCFTRERVTSLVRRNDCETRL